MDLRRSDRLLIKLMLDGNDTELLNISVSGCAFSQPEQEYVIGHTYKALLLLNHQPDIGEKRQQLPLELRVIMKTNQQWHAEFLTLSLRRTNKLSEVINALQRAHIRQDKLKLPRSQNQNSALQSSP
ncbi:hypothetical protein WH50_21400 [Pokkaliibacter plantistimulans]|uniref:PilZ domain-containing protein n=1 Tax=Pokkaliibacter plantistimulans TaxID=1635171 RepID=A0ABX5LV48_9GAMM|nr:hypothetical protein WH50_21400 [Pokkaliibacter plantistimulans]